MSAELLDAKTVTLTLLRADSTLAGYVGTRIFADLSPQGTGFPLIKVRAKHPSKSTTSIGNIRVLEQVLLDVDVQGQRTAPSTITLYENAANRIDQILMAAMSVASPAGRVCYGWRREGSVEKPDHTGGTHVFTLTQTYRVWVQSQPL